MKYFTLKECIHSDMAQEKSIDNTPIDEHKEHIIESIETLLNPLRKAWGQYCRNRGLGLQGIRVTSGYRTPELNKAVHGSASSEHCYGYAFDLVPSNLKIGEFKHFCRDFLSQHPFDQLISEKENKDGVPRWMHVGYKQHSTEAQRHQFLSMIDGKYFPMTD